MNKIVKEINEKETLCGSKIIKKKNKTMPKKKLNGYFQALAKARKNKAKSFEYKGKKYVQTEGKNGTILYKKSFWS